MQIPLFLGWFLLFCNDSGIIKCKYLCFTMIMAFLTADTVVPTMTHGVFVMVLAFLNVDTAFLFTMSLVFVSADTVVFLTIIASLSAGTIVFQ